MQIGTRPVGIMKTKLDNENDIKHNQNTNAERCNHFLAAIAVQGCPHPAWLPFAGCRRSAWNSHIPSVNLLQSVCVCCVCVWDGLRVSVFMCSMMVPDTSATYAGPCWPAAPAQWTWPVAPIVGRLHVHGRDPRVGHLGGCLDRKDCVFGATISQIAACRNML
jgi:hypothetical protein